MEHLFSTRIAVHKEHVLYDVVFDDEKYSFTSVEGNTDLPSFSLVREHDEWHDEGTIPHETRKQAIDALEKYLLKQH